MSEPFTPTHEITLIDPRDGAVRYIAVCLVDGVAYTEEEWQTETAADWECSDPDGAPNVCHWSF